MAEYTFHCTICGELILVDHALRQVDGNVYLVGECDVCNKQTWINVYSLLEEAVDGKVH